MPAITKKGYETMSKKVDYTGNSDINIENAAIRINRTEDFQQMAQQLSEFVAALHLDQPTNDRLVALIIEQVRQAEKDSFMQGFDMGLKYANYFHQCREQYNEPVMMS